MSHISVRGEQSSQDEITALQNLEALGTSGVGQFIKKTGATTFANANIGGANNGTAGQVLTSNGAGVAPSFQAAAGGSLTVGTTIIASGSNKVPVYSDGANWIVG